MFFLPHFDYTIRDAQDSSDDNSFFYVSADTYILHKPSEELVDSLVMKVCSCKVCVLGLVFVCSDSVWGFFFAVDGSFGDFGVFFLSFIADLRCMITWGF